MELYGLLTGVPAQRKLHGKDLDLLSYRECPKTKEKVLSYVSFLSPLLISPPPFYLVKPGKSFRALSICTCMAGAIPRDGG